MSQIKHDEANDYLLKYLGLTVEECNTRNFALYYKDLLDEFMREGRAKFALRGKDLSKMKSRGLMTWKRGRSGTMNPTMKWVRWCYPLGVPEKKFPRWRLHMRLLADFDVQNGTPRPLVRDQAVIDGRDAAPSNE